MSESITVLGSTQQIRPTTNPYIVQLVESLDEAPDVDQHFFNWKFALTGSYDVFHVHWPEQLFGGHKVTGRAARRALTALFMLRLRATNTPIVRTVHNLHRPDGLSRIDHLLLDEVDRRTVTRIRLNEQTEVVGSVATIPHGHYRDWFDNYPKQHATIGRIGYVGLIRRYKGVERLVEVFHELDDESLSLTVAGKASTEELSDHLRQIAGDDPRISFHFAFLDDAELVSAITAASLIVLPYKHMHNSGTVLAALSLDRPVLVPDNEVNRALAQEVGDGWIFTYDGELDADDLRRTLAAVGERAQDVRPDLSAREWDDAAGQHEAAFREAIAESSRRRSFGAKLRGILPSRRARQESRAS